MAKEAANGNTSGFCKHYGGTAGAGKTVPAVFHLIDSIIPTCFHAVMLM
ncbi:hypothetical protein [Neisseria dumasiana]|nr:hypothetical protein [Neisseria dumasiana]